MLTHKKDVVVITGDTACICDVDFRSPRYNNLYGRIYSFNLNKMEEDDLCIITNNRYLPFSNCDGNKAPIGSALFFANTPEYSMDKVRAAGYRVVYSIDKADYIVFSKENFDKKLSYKNCFTVYFDHENNIAYNSEMEAESRKYSCFYIKNCKVGMHSTICAIVNNDADRIILSDNLCLDVNDPTEDTFMTTIGAIKSRASFADVSALVNVFACTNWRKFTLSSYVLQAYVKSYTRKRVSSFNFTKDAMGFLNASISIYRIHPSREDIFICQQLYREMNDLATTEYIYNDFRDNTRHSESLLREIMPYCFDCVVYITDK